MQKTNFKTRLLALLTAVFMVIVSIPFAAFADAEGLKEIKVAFYQYTDNGSVHAAGDFSLKPGEDNFIPSCFLSESGLDDSKLDHWTYQNGKADFKPGAPVTYNELAKLVTETDKEGVGYITLEPVFKTEKPVEKTAHISFNAYEYGTLVGTENENAVTYDVKDVDGATVTVPVVKAIDGYKFTGWTSNLEAKLDADTCGKEQFIAGWAYYQEGSTDGNIVFTAQFEKKEQPETQKHHFTVNFTVDPEKGSFTGIGAGPVVFQGYEEEVGDQQYEVPAVTAKEGYKFVGWKGQGASEIAWNADAKTFGISGLCFYQDGSYEGNASIEAVFEEVKQPETPKHHFTVNFTVDPEKGSFTGIGAGPVVFQGYEEEVGDQQYDVPAVTAKEGYKFVGWKGQGASEIAWDADAKSFGVSGLCFYQNGSNDGYASIEAVFEPTVKLTDIKVNFLKEDGTTVVSAAQYIAKDATLVLPYDVKGVIGWKLANNLTTYDVKTKFSFDDLAAFVGTNYAADGTANLTFYAQYKTEVELKNITIKYVEDKDGAQEDVAAPQNNFTAKDEFTILTDNLYDGKVPAGKKLIGWQYKNGGNTTNFVKGEHVKFDTLKALLNGNWDNEGNAWVTLTPVFQDVKSNNSSSSSSSSSSNKTTTASNEKQVVKAAAAPANTTKVLPKTGASNVAPLLGGSLAVVALLMGYGVYSLVLRKKD